MEVEVETGNECSRRCSTAVSTRNSSLSARRRGHFCIGFMQSWIPVLRLYFQSLIWYMESTYFNMGGEVVYCILYTSTPSKTVSMHRLICILSETCISFYLFHLPDSIFLIAILYYNRLILYILLVYQYLVYLLYLRVSTDIAIEISPQRGEVIDYIMRGNLGVARCTSSDSHYTPGHSRSSRN